MAVNAFSLYFDLEGAGTSVGGFSAVGSEISCSVSSGACRQMCVVKVNRVEGDSVRRSKKELLHSSSPVKTDPTAETDPDPDPDPDPDLFRGSGGVNRTADVPGQWAEASPLHPGTKEGQPDLPPSQDDIIRNPTPEEEPVQLVFHSTGAWSGQACSGPSDSETQTSRRQDVSSQTPTSEDSMDTGPEDAAGGSKRSTEAPEPVGGGSSPSPHSLDCSLEPSSSDMPLLSPEPEDKPSVCLLPPVLTQEMPSLTPAHDGIPPVSRLTSCSNQMAPVLQREAPTGSLSSHTAKREPDGVKSEHAPSWHLASLYDCEAPPRNTALTASATHGSAPADVHAVLSKPDGAAETGHTRVKGVCSEGGADRHRPVQDETPPPERDRLPTKLTNTDHGAQPGPAVDGLAPSTAASLLKGASAQNPSPPAEAVSPSALELPPPQHTRIALPPPLTLSPSPFPAAYGET